MQDRVRVLNDAAARADAHYVLYWARMNHRVDSNHALLWAADEANQRKLPVLVFEELTCDGPEANDRMHTFVLEGVPGMAARLEKLGIGYCFSLRKRRSDAVDMLERLARQAALIVTDDYPTSTAREHDASIPERIGIPYVVVDSSCIVPMNRMTKREYAAYTIRPKINKLLHQYLEPCPPLRVQRRWDRPIPEWHTPVTPESIPSLVAECEIDHSVPPSISYTGGAEAAHRGLQEFVKNRLRRYDADRNQPSAHATSDMSPYLHFGMISSLELALAVSAGAKQLGLSAESFLEELVVRRELAFNYARFCEHPGSLVNLPEWAKETLRKHAKDHRDPVYDAATFEKARTHDPLWNACQTEMMLRGKIHGYYRMYWGKKIIEWSRTCQDALETMIHIHDRYALDGRDPNTYTNILWCFGLHDRPWQERPIFGIVRYMSTDGMKRKTDVESYLREIRHLESTGKDPFRVHG